MLTLISDWLCQRKVAFDRQPLGKRWPLTLRYYMRLICLIDAYRPTQRGETWREAIRLAHRIAIEGAEFVEQVHEEIDLHKSVGLM